MIIFSIAVFIILIVFISFKQKRPSIIFILLIFSDYIAIALKQNFDTQFSGLIKELTITSYLVILMFYGKIKLIREITLLFLIIASHALMLLNHEYRPTHNIILILIICYYLNKKNYLIKHQNPLILTLLLTLICTYQFLTIKLIEDFWFYDFFAETTPPAHFSYFRNGMPRPTGPFVSPSIFSLVFLSIYIYSDLSMRKRKFIIKALCLTSMLLIQTKVIVLSIVLYELMKLFKRKQFVFIIFSSLTFYFITIFGDLGDNIRISLWLNYLENIKNLQAFQPQLEKSPIDSQLLYILESLGIFGLIFIIISFLKKRNSLQNSIFFIIIYISIFQWSDSSIGYISLITFSLVNLDLMGLKFQPYKIPRRAPALGLRCRCMSR